ncbi:MAG: GTP cyclohydrolase I FolE [Leptospirales bacterium]|nr:GTP cyclohydrolase I FolE [Leptospirales bacterium]
MTRAEQAARELLAAVGEDPAREGLLSTPARYAKALDFLTSGNRMSLQQIVNGAIFSDAPSEMVIARDIEVYSLCEHHILPFFGRACIGYIPRGRVIGLSKLARVVDMFARRLQVQERMTTQIAEAIQELLQPDGVAVVIRCKHMCMMMRGVEKQNSEVLTSAMLGSFRDSESTRMEFLNLSQASRST